MSATVDSRIMVQRTAWVRVIGRRHRSVNRVSSLSERETTGIVILPAVSS